MTLTINQRFENARIKCHQKSIKEIVALPNILEPDIFNIFLISTRARFSLRTSALHYPHRATLSKYTKSD